MQNDPIEASLKQFYADRAAWYMGESGALHPDKARAAHEERCRQVAEKLFDKE